MNLTAKDGLDEFIKRALKEGKKTVLDIGCGIDQPHTKLMREAGLEVFTCDFFDDNDYKGLFTEIDFKTNLAQYFTGGL